MEIPNFNGEILTQNDDRLLVSLTSDITRRAYKAEIHFVLPFFITVRLYTGVTVQPKDVHQMKQRLIRQGLNRVVSIHAQHLCLKDIVFDPHAVSLRLKEMVVSSDQLIARLNHEPPNS